jgi:hypothetical protein
MDAGEDDDVGVDLRRLARQGEGVADDVRNAVIDLRRLVVVRQDDRVTLFLQPVDRLDVRCVEGPFDLRNDSGAVASATSGEYFNAVMAPMPVSSPG